MADLLQQFIVDIPVDSRAIIERQACVECKSLEICNRININQSILGILKDFLDGNIAFKVKNWHI